MSRLTVKQLMILMSGLLGLVMIAVIVAAQLRLGEISDTTHANRERIDAALAARDVQFRVVQIQQFLTDVGATHDEGGFEEARDNLAEAEAGLDRLVKVRPATQSAAERIRGQLDKLHEVGVRMAKAYIAEGREAGNALMKAPGTGLDDASAALAENLEALAAEVNSELNEVSDGLQSSVDTTRSLMLSFSVGFLLFFVGAMFLFYRKTITPLERLRESLHDIAEGEGDLSIQLDARGRDEMADVARSFNMFTGKIRGLVRQVSSSVSQLAVASDATYEVTDAAKNGMVQLQSSTDQVATAMNQMTATVQEVARNAANAAQAAHEADMEAQNGKQVVGEVVDSIDALAREVEQAAETIHRLEADSEAIGGVLDVIRGIADQTNLLALNAAIEAARAGEQGRGFAVVADEVRTLAQRTQESTLEIQAMIERLQGGARDAVTTMDGGRKQAETSVGRAARAGESLTTITEAVGIINDMNSQIATAGEQQTAVAEDINTNVVHIRDVAGETLEKAQENVANSGTAGNLLSELTGLVQQFKYQGADDVDLSAAKSAHIAWKQRLRSFLDGNASLSRDQAVSHKDCQFGRWYYAEGLGKLGHVPEMREIEAPHTELHRIIQQVVEHKQRNDVERAESAYTQVGPLSARIVSLMDAVEAAGRR